MPSDVGRAWDDLSRRWRSLWATGPPAREAQAALREFFDAVRGELDRQRRAVEALRTERREVREVRPSPPPPARKPEPPGPSPALLEAKSRARLERALGYRFQDPRLLEEALAHPSFTNENPELGLPSNYRLAFLGDAALGFLVADLLHTEFPDADQAALTEMRVKLVDRPALARAAARIRLGEHLFLGRGEEAEGRENPTILAEACEALLGAVYRDGGLPAAVKVARHLLEPERQAPRKARAQSRRPRGAR